MSEWGHDHDRGQTRTQMAEADSLFFPVKPAFSVEAFSKLRASSDAVAEKSYRQLVREGASHSSVRSTFRELQQQTRAAREAQVSAVRRLETNRQAASERRAEARRLASEREAVRQQSAEVEATPLPPPNVRVPGFRGVNPPTSISSHRAAIGEDRMMQHARKTSDLARQASAMPGKRGIAPPPSVARTRASSFSLGVLEEAEAQALAPPSYRELVREGKASHASVLSNLKQLQERTVTEREAQANVARRHETNRQAATERQDRARVLVAEREALKKAEAEAEARRAQEERVRAQREEAAAKEAAERK